MKLNEQNNKKATVFTLIRIVMRRWHYERLANGISRQFYAFFPSQSISILFYFASTTKHFNNVKLFTWSHCNAKPLTDHIFSSLLLFWVWGTVYGVDRRDWFQPKPLITFLNLPSRQPLWSWPTQIPKNHFNTSSNLRGLNAWPTIWAKEHQN